MFQYSLPARHTNNGLDILVQYPTAFRTFFAEELPNRQVLVGYLLLSYNDNRYSQRQLGDEAVVTLRGKNQPRTQGPRPRLISNFFYVALLMMTSPLFLCFNVYYFTINSLQSAVCSLQSAVCSLRSAVCSLQSAVCSLQSAVCGLQSAVCSLQMSYTGKTTTLRNSSVYTKTNFQFLSVSFYSIKANS